MPPASGDVRAYLRYLAGWVWAEQDEASNFGLSLQEETITEMLLLRMARDCSRFGLSVKLFNKKQEGGTTKGGVMIPGTGADWEWYFESPDCSVGFRIQAKRLRAKPSKPGEYEGIKSKPNQAKDLINAASAIGFNPIYIFFNHPNVADHSLFASSTVPDMFGRSCWGCSVALANFVASTGNHKLADLHAGMMPWHRFFRFGKSCRIPIAMAGMEGDQRFLESPSRPEWVDRLREGGFGLEEYLSERRLNGVALFEMSEDWIE